jgi:hypothetical protein
MGHFWTGHFWTPETVFSGVQKSPSRKARPLIRNDDRTLKRDIDFWTPLPPAARLSRNGVQK